MRRPRDEADFLDDIADETRQYLQNHPEARKLKPDVLAGKYGMLKCRKSVRNKVLRRLEAEGLYQGFCRGAKQHVAI